MNEAQQQALKQAIDENAVIFCMLRAMVVTHPSPRVLLDAFNVAFEQLVAPMEYDPKLAARIEALRDQHRLLAGLVEDRLQRPRQGGASGMA